MSEHNDFRYSGTELEAMAHAPNYYRAILGRFSPFLGRRVVEVGAGVGTFSQLLLTNPGVEHLTLLEPADNNFPILRDRFAGESKVEAIHGYLEDHAGRLKADSIVIVNVLEHIPDDVGFLDAAFRALVPGGRLFIFVPAMPALFGSLDEEFEHYRRYSRPDLKGRVANAGFEIKKLYYVNLPGALAWFVVGRVLRRRTLSSRDVRMYDRWVVPSMIKLESIHPPPCGQSLLAIAEVPRR